MTESKRTRPQALVYYSVSIPAIILVFLFTLDIAAKASILLPLSFLGDWGLLLAQTLPWLLIAGSFYALCSFRPSLLVIILTGSFFVLTTVNGQVDSLVASSVVAACFLSLIGFNFARATKILGTRTLRLTSVGPYWPRLTSLGFDLLLPLTVAFGLVTTVAYLVSLIKAWVVSLPEPLSTLASSYLASHVYLIFTIITLAGVTVWMMRQLAEPLIMWFTLRAEDARKEAWYQLEKDVAKIWLETSRRPTSGKAMLGFSFLLLFIATVYLVALAGPNRTLNSLLSLVGLGQLEPSRPGLFVEASAKNLVRQVDYWAAWLGDVVRLVIRILWG